MMLPTPDEVATRLGSDFSAGASVYLEVNRFGRFNLSSSGLRVWPRSNLSTSMRVLSTDSTVLRAIAGSLLESVYLDSL